MKIARETFHGPDRLTVVAGEVYPDDAGVVKRYPDKFVDPEQVAEGRRHRSHSFTVEDARAKPGELSKARAVKPRKSPSKTTKADEKAD